jgi:hypothetical protein
MFPSIMIMYLLSIIEGNVFVFKIEYSILELIVTFTPYYRLTITFARTII